MSKKAWEPTAAEQQAAATKVKCLLIKNGLNQTMIAERAGVRPPVINRIIQGRRDQDWLRQFVANQLGFEDWNSMINTEVRV